MEDLDHSGTCEGPYDLFGTMRFSRMGPGDPTFSLTNDTVQRAFWFRGTPSTLMARVVDGRIVYRVDGEAADQVLELAPQLLGWNTPGFNAQGHPLLEQLSRRFQGVRRLTNSRST